MTRTMENEISEAATDGRHAKKARAPYIKYGIIAAYFFAVLCMILYCNSQVTQLAAENSRLKNEIAELESDNKMLSANIEEAYNLSYVEEYAKNVLGMVKLDKSDVNYVELSDKARMTLAAPEKNESAVLSGITRSFNIVLEYLN